MTEAIAAPASAPVEARARVYGEPLVALPPDLYIPPDALEVILEAFEGPLDLLLYLIRKHNLDILDIPMAELCRQYMEYVDRIRAKQLELAAEYLVMAAMLTEIKSRMLLPRPPREEGEAPAEDPRAELVRRLLEYEQIKYAARQLDELPQVGRDLHLVHVYLEKVAVARLPQVSVADLAAAWEAIVARARRNMHHHVTREELSVREHMSRVLRVLSVEGYKAFSELFDPAAGVPELVVTFLAILELAKQRMIEITQAEVYAPIYVKLAEADPDEREPESESE
ncbi:segregation and condensation protein A [Thiobacter aerophilum]|uniref:Segregation and condensation protein A n=1 Tax=Thiobacter aerophilum TaxID=3121275 RepID=A0ABV0EB00_9BURK